MRLVWAERAWEDYQWWQGQDRKTLRRINALLRSVMRDGRPMGKAELLKGAPGCASVRIDEKNRLTYCLDGDDLVVLSCRGHYEDR